MNLRPFPFLACTAVAALVFPALLAVAEPAERPNIVLILADDLGYGDLSSYGATDIRTPHIDRLAGEGIRFTHFYAAANTCSPSRAALLTGRYPLRTGVNAVLFHDTPEGLPPSERTIAEILRDAGYATAMIGKWHLGHREEFMPWNQGFDAFFGVPYSNDEKNFFLYESADGTYRRFADPVDQRFLIQRYTSRALAFIEQHAGDAEPFFLYVAHNAPHVPLYPSERFRGRSKRGIYGDVVEELDASVGQLLARLEELHIDDRTLVVFSSDNGPWLSMRDWGGDAGGLRDGKLSAFEGGQRVPALARWRGRIPPGFTYDGMANMMDWLPTFTHLAGGQVPKDREIDGKDIRPVLFGRGDREQGPFFYFQLRPPFLAGLEHKLAGVREGNWKLKLPRAGYYPRLLEPLMKVGLYWHGWLLFDLGTDPAERHNLADEHPEVVDRLRALIDDFEGATTPGRPVMVSAAPADRRGWEKMWMGIGLTAVLVLTVFLLLLYLCVRVSRHVLKKRQKTPGGW
jgi:arylsulfatase A-like enzyme